MLPDYDVMVIGGGYLGRYAAAIASRWGRCALWESDSASYLSPPAIYQQLLMYRQFQNWHNDPTRPDLHQFDQVLAYALTINQYALRPYSLDVLASLGVEVLQGEGELRQHRGSLYVDRGNRSLRAKYYLLAIAPQAGLPAIAGLDVLDYLTPSQVDAATPLAKHWTVLGNLWQSLEWGQFLRRFGVQVTLITDRKRLWPDPEISRSLQGQLEAEGIEVLVASPVDMVKKIDGQPWLQAGDHALETDQILICPEYLGDVLPVNLSEAGIIWQDGYIVSNAFGQTSNPQVYVCRDRLGNYRANHVGEYQAQIALHNLSHRRQRPRQDKYLPKVLATYPPLAQVGSPQPRSTRLTSSTFGSAIALTTGVDTGLCQLWVAPNAEILGGVCLGPQAAETIAQLALAIQSGLSIQAIARYPSRHPSLAQVCQQAARQWSDDRSPWLKLQAKLAALGRTLID